MKNRGGIDRINTLIDTLQQIQISSATVLSELHEIKRELALHNRKEQDTKQEPPSDTKAASKEQQRKNDTSPDIESRNTGKRAPSKHIDSKGCGINIGNTVRVLSTGLFSGNTGVVTKLGKARVSIRLPLGRTTNRKSTNLEVINTHV